ncbi:MAG: hypothetical protein QOG52_2243 [Frankiaceae bacterium]|jgi:uncharacterized protein (TIGR03083 family)|nr:hypothetical protein [Frankiaceae bacterium]
MTKTAQRDTAPLVISTLDRATLMRLAATEYGRCADVVSALRGVDWARRTDCPDWDIRALTGHMVGMTEMAASLRVNFRQMRAAKRRGGVFIDALTAVQVEETRALSNEQIVARFRVIGPRAARARRRTPGFVRRRAMPQPQMVGGIEEVWSLGYLIDTILTRDPWMHRIDLCRAVGVTPVVTADHDGVLVADVVTEWAARHGQACEVRLGGEAGGSWSFGASGESIELDAIEFCRALSGRAAMSGLLATQVPF